MKEYLEYKDEKSAKFWEIDLAEGSCDVHMRYGKIGAKGTQSAKSFNTPGQAQAYYDKQKSAKLKKGYVLEGSEASTSDVTPARETPPLAEFLCSPSEESQKLGLELVKNLLETDPEAIDVPALVLVAYVNIDYDKSKHSAVRKEALRLVKALPKPPKDLGGEFHQRYVKYICENATAEVITRMIRLSLENGWDDNELRWDDTRLRALPKELAGFPELTELDVTEAYLTAFPDILFELPNLRYFNFYASKIPELPPSIVKMQQLETMELERNALTTLPDEIGQMKNLKRLNLYKNKITELPESIVELENLEFLRLEGNPMNAPGQVEKLVEGFHEDKTDIATRRVLINLIFARNDRASELADVDTLIDALDSKLALVRSNALIALGVKIDADYRATPLAEGAKLAVIGKTGTSATEIKLRLEEYGIEAATAIKKDTTHVLLGEKPGKKRESLRTFKGVLLTESDVTQFLHAKETPMFLDADQDTGDAQKNIGELMLSDDTDNQALALEMLKSAGVSREIMTPLFLLYRLAEAKKVRDTAKALLLQNASSGFTQMINKNQNFKTATEKAADKYMNELSDFEELDVTLLAKLYCQKRKLGLNYFFEHGDRADVTIALADMVDTQGVLELRYCNLRMLPEELGEVQAITKLDLHGNELTALPASLSKLQRLTEIDASYNKLTDLPEGLSALVKLDVGANRIRKLPKALLGYTSLQELDVEGNAIKKLPIEFAGLSSIKVLRFGWDTMQGVPESILAFTQLEHLDLSAGCVQPLPEGFAELKALKSLSLSSCGLSEVPAPVLALKGLKELNLAHNQLKSLPDELSALTGLEELDLTFSRFDEFPMVLTRMSGLRKLGLSWSGGFELPDELANLSGLEELDVGADELVQRARAMLPGCRVG